ncbi:MAG: winged helix-turn-helix transcriptional regulator [Chloroflexi bacterium]|nr:winged helix-turn-helix transcriptional regulator [Chloroflexota bacterium]
MIGDSDRLLEVFRLQADLCKSLADAKRLMIIHHLRDGPKSVGELAEAIGSKQSNTSQHLGVLRKAGVVCATRQGNIVRYSLVIPGIAMACDIVREAVGEILQRERSLSDIM